MSVATVTLTGDALVGVGPKPPHLFAAAPQTVRLGAVLRKAPAMVPRLGGYLPRLADVAATLPPKVDYAAKAMASIGRMYRNNALGCCVISGKAHFVGVWTGNDGEVAVLLATDGEIEKVYFYFSPRDQGCVITEVLDYMRAKGLVFGGRACKIDGYVSVDNTNADEVKAAIYLFGGLTLGIDLPGAWTNSDVWDVTNSRSVGGHDVTVVGYDEKGVYVSSWGKLYLITWAAFTSRRYLTECYALLSPDWYGADGKAAAVGLDAKTLADDLAKLGGGVIPDITPPAPPVPPKPATVTVSIPGLPVTRFGLTLGYTPAWTGTFAVDQPKQMQGAFGVAWLDLARDLWRLRGDLAAVDFAGARAAVGSLWAALLAWDWAGVKANLSALRDCFSDADWAAVLLDLEAIAGDLGLFSAAEFKKG